jgi:hypothetical protein
VLQRSNLTSSNSRWKRPGPNDRKIALRQNCLRFQQTTFAKKQSLPMVKSVLLAALICTAAVCASSGQDTKVSVDMMGIGGLSCAHWRSTPALRLEGTIWIYGFWTGLNYVAAASGQTERKVDMAAIMIEVKKTCAQGPSQPLASAVWTTYIELDKR